MSFRVVWAEPKLYREVNRSLSRKWLHKKVLDTFPTETLELTKYSYNVTSSGFGEAKIVSRSEFGLCHENGLHKKVLDKFPAETLELTYFI